MYARTSLGASFRANDNILRPVTTQNQLLPYKIPSSSPEGSRIDEDLTSWEVWGYSFMLPMLCLVGVVANSISLIVLVAGKLKESLYTYLTGKILIFFIYNNKNFCH